MKKYLLFFAVIALFATSCCENDDKSNDADNKSSDVVVVEEIAPVMVAEFDDKAGEFVGKKIKMKGTVDHICKHGGQRLFLVSEDSEARIKITPDEGIAAFSTDLEGNNIVLVGIVEEQRIDEDYLREWEEEIKSGSDMADDKGEGSHIGGVVEKGGEGADMGEEMEKVNNMRQMIKESGDDYLSFYSVLCTSYEIVGEDSNEGHDHDNEGEHNH